MAGQELGDRGGQSDHDTVRLKFVSERDDEVQCSGKLVDCVSPGDRTESDDGGSALGSLCGAMLHLYNNGPVVRGSDLKEDRDVGHIQYGQALSQPIHWL
jgi:hypothetical protein